MALARTESEAWWTRAQRVIPGGTQTASKSPSQWVDGVLPIFLKRGRGGHVWDIDGNEWIDFPMALGPVLLGHAEPAVEEAIIRQLRDGIVFTLMHPLEVEVAERIVTMCPGVDAVRFAKTGSEATSGAVRVARALTGRDRVLVCGYHGWHDWYAASTPQAKGVPRAASRLVSTFPFNDTGRLGELLAEGDVAAVVLEPTGAALPTPGFLDGVVELCRRNGAVSIFDEMISGFRVAPGGARERYAVTPDLSCYGKALGNGTPIAAVAGRDEVMREFNHIFFSGTYVGETLSLAAARTVLDIIADGEPLARIAAVGARLMAGMRAVIEHHGVGDQVRVDGEPCRPVMSFGTPLGTSFGADGLLAKSWVQQCLAESGILFAGAFNVCARHSDDDVQTTLEAFDRACAGLTEHGDLASRLRGGPIAPAIRPA